MKLIHLPTGEHQEWSEQQGQSILRMNPSIYIRAELPEYWRVEGYDKSWEWFGCPVHLDFVGIDKQGEHWASNDFYQDYPQISRSEFEYHIYNPWKAQKETDSPLSNDNEQLDMSDVDKLREAAEKLGYELVFKNEWATEFNKYKIESHWITITDVEDNDKVCIKPDELETLIEKYNQFKSNS